MRPLGMIAGVSLTLMSTRRRGAHLRSFRGAPGSLSPAGSGDAVVALKTIRSSSARSTTWARRGRSLLSTRPAHRRGAGGCHFVTICAEQGAVQDRILAAQDGVHSRQVSVTGLAARFEPCLGSRPWRQPSAPLDGRKDAARLNKGLAAGEPRQRRQRIAKPFIRTNQPDPQTRTAAAGACCVEAIGSGARRANETDHPWL
jgi:hypothetical protein